MMLFLPVKLAAVLALAGAAVCTASESEVERLAKLRFAVERGGMEGLLDKIATEHWPAPSIPSKWHLDERSTRGERPLDLAARDLGKAIAMELKNVAPILQREHRAESLYDLGNRLCDLAEWCGRVEGYGNAFLAGRCVDLAAVAAARLAADLNFDLERVGGLVGRLREPWCESRFRAVVLNKEVGVEIFTSEQQEEITRTWGTGLGELAEDQDPGFTQRLMEQLPAEMRTKAEEARANAQTTSAMRENLGFFQDDDAAAIRPKTLVTMWDHKLHEMLVVGAIASQNVEMVWALIEFRRTVGDFPKETVWPELTEQQKHDVEWEKKYNAEHGIVTTSFEEGFESRAEAAFCQAWHARVTIKPEISNEEANERRNRWVLAWQAYNRVQKGEFLDRDSFAEKFER